MAVVYASLGEGAGGVIGKGVQCKPVGCRLVTVARQVQPNDRARALEVQRKRSEIVLVAKQPVQHDPWQRYTRATSYGISHAVYAEMNRRMARLVEDATPTVLEGRRVGLEKESLRVDAQGAIAATDHPEALGAALCHPSITTDFSEALVEMVTPPMATAAEALDHLESTHRYVAARLPAGETLWNASMPCIIDDDESIRIGQYGSSFSGRMKHIYRRGLGLRYGRRMQAIAGIHFNFSLPDSAWDWRLAQAGAPESSNSAYFSMMQNLMGIGWIVPYLFGASSAICRSFLDDGAITDLQALGDSTLVEPFGTSLRMGNIGYRYREDRKIDLTVDHRCLDAWIADVLAHVTHEHPAYATLGEFDADGQRQQLNVNRLQIENEYYGTVRPKQIPRAGEMPILALADRGIRYLELRSLDIDMFEPTGLSADTVAMLELLMLFAWLADPLPLDDVDMQRVKSNFERVAHRGRQPELTLEGPDGSLPLDVWAESIVASLQPLAEWLDDATDDTRYQHTLELQLSRISAPDTLPSARVLEGVQASGCFSSFGAELSRRHHDHLLAEPPRSDHARELDEAVEQSLRMRDQLERESSDDDFETRLADWFSQLDAQRSGSGVATGTSTARS